MKITKFNITAAMTITAALLTVFQNCAPAEFTANGDEDLKTQGTPIVTVCDPFSAGSACPITPPGGGPTPGLKGNVYYYPNGKKVDDYINLGQRLNVLVQMSHLDVPLRSWQTGFPGPNGGILDNSGNLLIEYFAIDLTGFFQLPSSIAEGDYQFATNSDDGTILYFDGKEIVNNDGDHPMTWKCAPAAFNLKYADKHTMRLKYYQGPRVEIGLQVYYRPWSKKNRPCDASGGWQIIPAAGLSH